MFWLLGIMFIIKMGDLASHIIYIYLLDSG